ncbi:GntR family transcriptional regulator [Allopusillimonas soli]|uniref:GntR family transcriptional regulator n=1 Tax=Allopusillimonas soli TaxID=659016 RepID=A0A853FJS7_9BURK|nr:GntR family transcriptional regulator [Allopusillimonas soli]NYT38631.1 GntR family transcriptional regulator [Allopusillimonas soli]TEA71658.1 GntR family transcriptional regulator [Allopusillimonas soli]
MAQRIIQQVLYQQVADRLRAMIQSGELQAGAWIDESQLTSELGISRTPLREALKVLVAEGLLRLEPRRGCFVNQLSVRDLDDIFPLMAMLEGRCAFEAARKVTDEDLRRLEPLHQRLQEHAKLGDIDQYYASNAVIHEAVQALADNRWLSDLIDNLRKLLSLSRHRSLVVPGRIADSCAEHMAIFAALKARDPEGAEALTRKHLMRQLDALHILAAQDECDTTERAAALTAGD